MKIKESSKFIKFIESSYALLIDYDKKGRYYHTLHKNDNSPTVVHKHTNQYTYVIAGKGKIFINGIEKEIVDGDSFFIEAGEHHRFLADSEEMTLFHIHIPDEGRDSDRYIVQGEDYDRYEV